MLPERFAVAANLPTPRPGVMAGCSHNVGWYHRSRHQQSRPRTSELIHDLPQRRLVRNRRSGAGVVLTFSRDHEPQGQRADHRERVPGT
jgi:hypothetical protein